MEKRTKTAVPWWLNFDPYPPQGAGALSRRLQLAAIRANKNTTYVSHGQVLVSDAGLG